MSYNPLTKFVYVNRTNPNNPIGIKLDEIRAALNADPGDELSRHANINKWAKYKPLPIGNMKKYEASDAQLINYGLNVPYYKNFHMMLQDILSNTWTRALNYDANKPFWTYTGLGQNNWSRVLDFDKYLGTAKEPMSAITVNASYCGIDDTPTFISHNESTTEGNLAPKDLRVIENNTILSGSEDMYYGIFLYNDNAGVGRQFEILGKAADLTTGDKRIIDSRFAFPRLGDEQAILSCIFLSNYNIGNGAVVRDQDNFTGLFIPLTMTRATNFITFEKITANLSANPDTISQWWPINPDVIFVFKALPNKTSTWIGSLIAQNKNNDVLQDIIYGEDFTINLPKVRDENLDIQYPCFIRLQTDGANGKMLVETYVTDPSVTFNDVANKNTAVIGDPLSSQEVAIYGEILSGNNNFTWANITIVSSELTEYSEGCDIGNLVNNN